MGERVEVEVVDDSIERIVLKSVVLQLDRDSERAWSMYREKQKDGDAKATDHAHAFELGHLGEVEP